MTTTCPKCSGTGIIPALAHVKNGECFDCGGTGRVAAVFAANDALRSARAVGTAVQAGDAVASADIDAALAHFETIGPVGWREQDYGHRNALVAVVAARGEAERAARAAARRERMAARR